MKTVLTLNSGSFFFLENIHLIRGIAQEVDTSTLSPEDHKALQVYIASGHILSTEAVEDKKEAQKETKKVEEIKEEEVTVDVQTEETVKGPYDDLNKRELKALITERAIETEATSNADLIKELEAYDAAQAQ